jgi:hypothetical protein
VTQLIQLGRLNFTIQLSTTFPSLAFPNCRKCLVRAYDQR